MAFGVSPHLEACIASIKRQARAPDLVRVATSTPNEHIERVARRHDLPIVANPVAGGGIAADWNFALRSARAELVTLAHQDDVYEPAYARSMVAALARHPASLIGFSDFVELGGRGEAPDSLNNKVKRSIARRVFGAREAIHEAAQKRRLLAFGNPICCPTVTFNRSQLGAFEFASALRSNLDWDAWLRLSAREGAFVYVREALVKRRNHPDNATAGLIRNRGRLHEDRAMFRRLWPTPVAELLTQFYKLGYLGNSR